MSQHDYAIGRRDGKEMTYDPPVPTRVFTSRPPEEQQRLDDYYQGYKHGKQDYEDGKK
jgi:hypothetical protein